VTEIRSKFRDVHVAFLHWAALYRNKTKSRYKDGEEVLEKIRDLSAYYEARKPWLDPRTRNMLEATKEEINNWLIELMGAAAATELRDPRSDEDEVAERVYKWVGGGLFQREEFPPGSLPKLLEGFDKEVDRVLGNRPWWNRLFG
jgi:hypothetical protein